MSSTDTLGIFFDRLWGEEEGYVYLPTRSSNNIWEPAFSVWPARRVDIVQYILKCVAEQKEVYFAPALYSQPKLGKEYVKGSKVLWADFDGDEVGTPAPEDWSALSEVVSEPSMRVQTSSRTNQHVYWLLDKFTEDKDWVEQKNRSIAYTINADTACWNIDRLLRPPETINFGYSKPQRLGKKYETSLEEVSDREYSGTEFSHLRHIRPLVQDSLIKQERVPIDYLKMKARWTDELIAIFTKPLHEFSPDFDRSRGLVSIGYQAAELGWTDSQIYTIICDVDDRWAKYKDRDDCELQRSNIVERVRRKYPYVGDNPFANLLTSKAEPTVVQKVVYSYKEFMELDIEINFIFEDLMEECGYGIIFGESGIGKTQLVLQMMRAVASGSDFIGYKNTAGKPLKAVFFSLEMTQKPLKYFLSKMHSALSDTEIAHIGENLDIIALGESMSLNKPEGKEFFQNILAETRPAVVFIDSLATMTTGALNDDEPARELLEYIQQVRKAYNCCIVVVHHANKSTLGAELHLRDSFGNTFLTTGTDFVFGVSYENKDDKSVLRVTECKLRLGAPRNYTIINRTSNLTFDLLGGGNVILGGNFRDESTGSDFGGFA